MRRIELADRLAVLHAGEPPCPICKRTADMWPSQWGHPSVRICHNPPCIYERTRQRSAEIIARARNLSIAG